MGTAPNFFSLSPKEGGHQELTQASPLHNSPSVVAGQVAFPPHAQSLPHSKKAALALPIHSLSLSFLPYNSPTQNRLYTQHASARLCDHVNTTNYFPPSSPPRNHSKCPRLLLVSAVRPRRPSAARRTPTPPSVASPPTCSSPTSSVRTSVRRTLVSLSVKSASSSVSDGRLLTRSNVLLMRPRLPLTRSDTRMRSRPTTPTRRRKSLPRREIMKSNPSVARQRNLNRTSPSTSAPRCRFFCSSGPSSLYFGLGGVV